MLDQFLLLHNLVSLEKIINADTNKLIYKRGKYTDRKLTDCSWEIDYNTVTLEVKTHFYIEIVHFGNKKNSNY